MCKPLVFSHCPLSWPTPTLMENQMQGPTWLIDRKKAIFAPLRGQFHPSLEVLISNLLLISGVCITTLDLGASCTVVSSRNLVDRASLGLFAFSGGHNGLVLLVLTQQQVRYRFYRLQLGLACLI